MKTFALIAVTTAALGLAACSSTMNPAYKAPGKYETSSTNKTSSGTTYKTNKTTNVEVDQYGNRKATVETQTSIDPEGMMNKSSSKTKSTY